MKTSLFVVPSLFLAACATTSGGGGGGKSSSAPFQGQAAVQKRQTEIQEAARTAMECMKVKKGEDPGKGGVFAVVADAAGKLKIDVVKWDGAEPMKQCIVDTGNKVTVTPLAGPAIGTLWEFLPPGVTPQPTKAPEEFGVKMQPLAETMQAEVASCGNKWLGTDFGATIDVAYYIFTTGKAFVPTVVSSDAKDGAFESCVQDVVTNTKFPVVQVERPFGATAHFRIGIYGTNERVH